jgi:beta-N-acetylhexosaminidase
MKGFMKKLRLIVFALTLALMFLPSAATQTKPYQPYDRALTSKEEKWVRDTLKRMTVDDKVGQMFLADAYITFWNRDNEAYKQLQHHIEDNKVGGVIVFRSEVWPTAILTNRWQELAKTPLLISADLEMGPGMRFDDTPWWAPNMAVAATGDPQWARLHGEATAKQARAMGVNWLYAPAVDVNNNPANPVINVRSYGEDPAQVSAFAKAFIEGAQTAGALACAKHFPGHGDTATDSHIGLPVVDVSRERLDKLELVPFRAAIDARVGSIMSAHIALPQIETELAAPVRAFSEGESSAAEFKSLTEETGVKVTLPGTLSPKVLTGILRDDLKFNGIVVTDAMNMAGVAARYTPAEAAIRAIKAGADLIIKSPDIDAAIAGVKQAVVKGELTEARLNTSVERLLRAKAALGLITRRTVDLNEVDRLVAGTKFNTIAQQIAERSITLVRDYQKLLPLDFSKLAEIQRPGNEASQPERQGRLFNLTFTDEDDPAITKPFVDELRTRVGVDSYLINRNATEEQIAFVLSKLDMHSYNAVLFSLAVRARSGKGSVALPPVGKRLAEELIKRHMTTRLPLLTISFGNPYLLNAMPDSPSYLLAWSPFPVSQRAAAKAVLGEIEINGKLPVTLPGLYERGSGMKVERRAGK